MWSYWWSESVCIVNVDENIQLTGSWKIDNWPSFSCFDHQAEINKAAGPEFNTRVAETRLGAKVLAKLLGLENWRSVQKFKQLGADLFGLLKSAKELLHPEPFTREEVCEVLGLSDDEVVAECLTENTRDLQSFNLHDRAVHVFSEAMRVYQFKSVCDEAASCDGHQPSGNDQEVKS